MDYSISFIPDTIPIAEEMRVVSIIRKLNSEIVHIKLILFNMSLNSRLFIWLINENKYKPGELAKYSPLFNRIMKVTSYCMTFNAGRRDILIIKLLSPTRGLFKYRLAMRNFKININNDYHIKIDTL